jgi:hypothetical protein
MPTRDAGGALGIGALRSAVCGAGARPDSAARLAALAKRSGPLRCCLGEGPDKKRSWHVSKAFGRYTKSLKLGEERRNFHSLRKTFIEAMEAAEVFESTTKLIVGNKRASLTYGHYYMGDRVKLRKYINKLKYPDEIMRLIRSASKPTATTAGDHKRTPKMRGHSQRGTKRL